MPRWPTEVYTAACCIVGLLPFILWRMRSNMGRNLLAVQIYFDLLQFPITTKLSSVFACTSFAEEPDVCDLKNKTVFTGKVGESVSVQTTPVDPNAYCMDAYPHVQCWTTEHMYLCQYSLVLMPLYYVLSLHLRTIAQVRNLFLSCSFIKGVRLLQFQTCSCFVAEQTEAHICGGR